ncbi:hypothetical protein Misp06_01613 [Microbulbifer sp. NBRC 101763]|uniref:hypothetical protein n=1 Tax=Microbulbifer TaxID=48073 RepID=UPI00036C9A87|nr:MULTISPECIES: hypothetical protein [Microbulbifer]WHI51966.1 hypothetical protein P3339_03825 [Microbulbifer sp. MLAF003]
MRLMIRSNHLPHLLVVVISLTLAFGSMPGSAQQQGANADFWEKYDDITDWVTLRLQLTPEQEKVVLPILQESFAEKKAVLEAYSLLSDKKIDLTPKQRGEIGAQMAAISAQTLKELKGKLNQKQLKEAGRIQHEFLREFANRLRVRAAQER